MSDIVITCTVYIYVYIIYTNCKCSIICHPKHKNIAKLNASLFIQDAFIYAYHDHFYSNFAWAASVHQLCVSLQY